MQQQDQDHVEIDGFEEAIRIGSVGTTLLKQGKTNEAVAAYRECILKLRPFGDTKNIAGCHLSIAAALFDPNDLTAAKQEVEMAVELYKQTDNDTQLASALELLDQIKKASRSNFSPLERLSQWLTKPRDRS